MKICIAYASKSGTAQEAARRLSAFLPGAELIDLAKETPVLDSFDAVIIGSGVRMGAIHKDARKFIDENKTNLCKKRRAFFITNSFPDSAAEIINAAIPEGLRACSDWVGTVGGRLDVESLKGFDKAIAKMVTRAVKDGQKVHEDINNASLEELAACFQ